MLQFFDTLTDDSGNSLLGATVTVTNYPSGTLATIYSANGTASPIPTAVVAADITGQVSFYAPDGAYTLTYAYKGTTYKVRSPVQFIDPMGFVAATDTGAANALVISGAQYPAQKYVGLKIEAKIAAANTGATTLNFQADGGFAVNQPGGTALSAALLQANGIARLEWDGVQWQLLSSAFTAGSVGGALYPRTTFEVTAGVVPINLAYPELNVLRYGADPTNTTDSGPAFNTAILVMVAKKASVGVGGAMIIPAGTYKIATQILINNDALGQCAFLGAGGATTVLSNQIVAAAGTPAESMIKLTCRNSDFLFQGFRIVGTNQNNASGNGNGHAIALVNPDPIGTAGNTTFYPQTVLFRDIQTRFHLGLGKDFTNDTATRTITGITQAALAVVTVNTVSGSNPYVQGQGFTISGVAGMTQINGQYATVVSTGGVSGAWTATVNINSTGYTAYSSGGTAAAGIPACSLYNYASTVHDMDHCYFYNDLMGVRCYLSEKTHFNQTTLDGNNGVGITGIYIDSCQDVRFVNGTLNGWGLGTSLIDGHVYLDAVAQQTNGISLETNRMKGSISNTNFVTPLLRADAPTSIVFNLSVRDCDLRQLNDSGSVHSTTFFRLGNGVRNAHIIDNYFLPASTFGTGGGSLVGVDCVQAVSGYQFAGLEVAGNSFDGGTGCTWLACIRLNISTNVARGTVLRKNVFGGANNFTITDAIRFDGNGTNPVIESNFFVPAAGGTITNCINFPNNNVQYPKIRTNTYDTTGTITNQIVGLTNCLNPERDEYGLKNTALTPTIASAATVTPTAEVCFVSGVTQINTINPPLGFGANSPYLQGAGRITFIPTGLWTMGVTGNIAIAVTAVVSKRLDLYFDASTAKWYPSYTS